MNQQEEGWPLGLQPLSLRLGLIRNCDFHGSFSTLDTDSSRSNSISTSDFDSESMEPLSKEKNITFGGILEASGRSWKRSRKLPDKSAEKKGRKNRAWFSLLCAKTELEVEREDGSATSLGQFLEMERKACDLHGICQASSHGIPLIFQCIRFGGQVRRRET